MLLQIPQSYQNLSSISPNKFVCIQFPLSYGERQHHFKETVLSDDTEQSADHQFSAVDSPSTPVKAVSSLKASTSLSRFNTFRLDDKLLDETKESSDLLESEQEKSSLEVSDTFFERKKKSCARKKLYEKEEALDAASSSSLSSTTSSSSPTSSEIPFNSAMANKEYETHNQPWVLDFNYTNLVAKRYLVKNFSQ